MAGIYIHIPFCKQACYYCDFHFSTNQELKQATVDAICQELQQRQSYLGNEIVETIYFGGGTPSLLSEKQLTQIFEKLYELFSITKGVEITLEGNPDDLNNEYLGMLKKVGINRLSIGIQSFNNDILSFLNRAHSAEQSFRVLSHARSFGFENISIDLIYAIPSEHQNLWISDLEQAMEVSPEHISSYGLTIEPRTVFGHQLKKGTFKEMSEDNAAEQFELLTQTLQSNGYDQYEISNFCKKGFHSRHNSNYWKQIAYLGVGPSAHSYNGVSRQYNISNNSKYLQGIKNESVFFEKEILNHKNMANEYILTTLRTKWGCNLSYLKQKHNIDLSQSHEHYLNQLLEKQLIHNNNNIITLTDTGKLLADQVAADLFVPI